MLAQHSVEVPSRDQLTARGDDDENDFGFTTQPVNFRVPLFRIICVPIGQRNWSATVQITQPAYEGDNEAYHLGPGLHSLGLMFSAGMLQAYVVGEGNRRIYAEVSAGISTDSCHAEEEHCRDIRYAYDITLNAVQNALSTAAQHGPYRGVNMVAAMQAAKAAIGNRLHNRLQGILHAADIPTGGVNMATFAAQLGQLYLTMCAKTQERDQRGWHHFDVDRTGESWSMRSWAEYASARVLPSSIHQYWSGDVKDIREVVRGPHFSVNVTLSQQIVML